MFHAKSTTLAIAACCGLAQADTEKCRNTCQNRMITENYSGGVTGAGYVRARKWDNHGNLLAHVAGPVDPANTREYWPYLSVVNRACIDLEKDCNGIIIGPNDPEARKRKK